MSSDYVYTMYRADKFYGPDRQVLANISLSFLPGAKIGVLGPNGAGKSTLLRIMAGKDEPSSGVAELAPGATVGLLEQEPELDPAKDVRGNVEDGVRPLRDLLDRFNEISAAFAEPDADFDTLLAEQAKVQDAIDRARRWQLDDKLDHAMDALRLPDGDRDVDDALGRRAAPRRALPAAPLLARPAAARRADEPPRRRVGRSGSSASSRTTRAPSSPSRTTATSSTTSPAGSSSSTAAAASRSRATTPRGSSRSRSGSRSRRRRSRRAAARSRASSSGCAPSPRARHAKAKARLGAYEKLLAEEQNVKLDSVEIHIPPGPRLGDVVIDADGVRKGFGDRLLVDDLTFSLPPAGIVGVVGPNGAGKTTLFRMIAGEEQPDDGTLRVGDTVELAYVDQARADLDPANNVWKEISGGHDTIELGKREVNSRQYVSLVQLQGLATSRSASATSRAASGTASTSRSSCARAATSSCSTSRRTTSTSTRCARSRRRCSTSPAAPS